jgi:hypothetical protein
MHCDISIGNMMLYRPDETKEATGLLVYSDLARTIVESDDDSVGNIKNQSAKNNVKYIWTLSGIYAHKTHQ